MGMKFFQFVLITLSTLVAAEEPSFTRSAHWVIRTSDLNQTIEYTKQVLGMRVLRHEENDEPCPITCNGDSPTAWSKTMIGTVTEDEGYALEVTYNYGVDKYPTGTGLTSFYILVDDLDASIKASWALGYPAKKHPKLSGQATSIGPDGYRYVLISKTMFLKQLNQPNVKEPFLSVKLNVGNMDRSIKFYTDILGMTQVKNKLSQFLSTTGDETDVILGYESPNENEELTLMTLHQSEVPPTIEQYEGRHAISIPAVKLQEAYSKIQANYPELIVHEIMELDEQLGILFIAIVKDFDGFEICLVSSETFDKAVKVAADFKEPDWELRKGLIEERKVQEKTRAARKMTGVIGGVATSSFVAPKDGADLKLRLTAVFEHVRDTAFSGKFSKKEGNFLVTGFWVGFFIVMTAVHQISLLSA